jgi:acetyltransferase
MECGLTASNSLIMTPAAQQIDSGNKGQQAVSADVAGQWPYHCTTRDGAEYQIRPIRTDDTERDCSFIEHLSDSSRYNRMMGLSRKPSAELLDHFVHVDYRREMALVAIIGAGVTETIIGVARYDGTPDACEFAIAVADEWQSRGIGATLARMLFAYAKTQGVHRIYGVIFANNVRMLKLAESLQMSVRRSSYDDSIVEAWRTL